MGIRLVQSLAQWAKGQPPSLVQWLRQRRRGGGELHLGQDVRRWAELASGRDVRAQVGSHPTKPHPTPQPFAPDPLVLTTAALRWAATRRSRSAGALPAPHTARATLPASRRTLRPRADPAQDRAAPPERPCRISRPRVDLPPISPPISPPGSRPRRRPRPQSGRFEIATPAEVETPARARRARRRRKTLPACGERWRATRAPPRSSRSANAAGATGGSWRHSWRRRREARKRREA